MGAAGLNVLDLDFISAINRGGQVADVTSGYSTKPYFHQELKTRIESTFLI